MNIILPTNKKHITMIFDKTKPYIFRYDLPKNLNINDIVYLLENEKDGCGKIVGYFIVKDFCEINHKLSKIGTYFHMDDYARLFCDKETIEMIEKAKSIKVENYYNSIVMSYLFQNEKLDYMLKEKKIPPREYFPTLSKEYKNYQEAKDKEWKFCSDCDKWLSDIGFYDEYDESYWKYEIVIKNPTRFKTPLPILNFIDKKGIPFKSIPRRYVYTNTNEIF